MERMMKTARSAVESDGKEESPSGRQPRSSGDGTDDAALTRATRRTGLKRAGESAQRKGEFSASTAEDVRRSVAAVSGEVLRFSIRYSREAAKCTMSS
jgi:hypothetical protein